LLANELNVNTSSFFYFSRKHLLIKKNKFTIPSIYELNQIDFFNSLGALTVISIVPIGAVNMMLRTDIVRTFY